jgi:hypothetical protein
MKQGAERLLKGTRIQHFDPRLYGQEADLGLGVAPTAAKDHQNPANSHPAPPRGEPLAPPRPLIEQALELRHDLASEGVRGQVALGLENQVTPTKCCGESDSAGLRHVPEGALAFKAAKGLRPLLEPPCVPEKGPRKIAKCFEAALAPVASAPREGAPAHNALGAAVRTARRISPSLTDEGKEESRDRGIRWGPTEVGSFLARGIRRGGWASHPQSLELWWGLSMATRVTNSSLKQPQIGRSRPLPPPQF